MFTNYIDKSKNDIILHLKDLINIPSMYDKSDNPLKPFGEYANQALEYVLNLGKEMGFKTKNLDGYCGYIEFGEGKNLIGIIGHLDVVPAGDGWDTPPFNATIKNGKLFGRGAIDDKGPVIATLYAMKAIKDNYKVNSRVRLILGLNEETSWDCINYYKKHEELPTIGFSPDANFPCIYAEKGICTMYLESDYIDRNQPIIITDIDCKNNAINVVPKYCSCTLKVDTSLITINDIKNYLKTIDTDISYEITDNFIKLTSIGKQAHAARPHLGINSISKLIVLLNDLFSKFQITNNILKFFSKHINTEYTGSSLNIAHGDESGILTLNVGDFMLENNTLKIGLNIRIPVNSPLEYVQNKINNICSSYNIKPILSRYQEPLYVSKDSYLVKTLCRIFNEETNSNYLPEAIGGGTYARAFDNCISFGPKMPKEPDMCHQANEYIEIDNLILASKIYAKAIYELQNYDMKVGN